ncbi:MAG TPA: hypothetical protein VMV89_11870 [Candidatus Paceibacterota bacterium]|nr:hypothetical protein [Candidatus Paceibacterota bacterium]
MLAFSQIGTSSNPISWSSGTAARVFNGLAGVIIKMARLVIEIAKASGELAMAFMGCLHGFNACRWSFIAS